MKKIRYLIIALLCALAQGAWADGTFTGGSGTSDDPYQIYDVTDWETLANNVNNGTTYKGVYFKMTSDVEVISNTMVGGYDANAFMGTFDGDGHTLILRYSGITEERAAPFRRISGATIKNLHVAGVIQTSARYAGGIVAYTRYYSRIENCRSSVIIESSNAGWSGHGGILALKAWVTQSEPVIEGCVFDGKILSVGTTEDTKTTGCGGIVGFTNGQTLTLRNCVYKPAALVNGETAAECSTIYRNSGSKPSTVTCENCYYFSVFGDTQGKQARSISGDDVTVAFAGTSTPYSVSGITAYKVNDKYCGIVLTTDGTNFTNYAGKDDEVSLNLTSGSANNGFIASAGTLTGSANPYTLTMPDKDVTISCNTSGCLRPTNLAINYTPGAHTTTVTWEGTADSYNIDINGTVTSSITSKFYEITNLDLLTQYSVKVQSVCGANGTSIWTDAITILTSPCYEEDMCAITLELNDSYGDGWNGAAIQVVDAEAQGDLVIATATIDDGYSKVVTLPLCTGRAVNFVWVSAGWDEETSYVVKDVSGDVIFSGSAGSGMITNYTVNCTSCRRPTDLTVTNVGKRSATLSWTENGNATAWKICLNGDEANLITTDNSQISTLNSQISFPLTGLTPSTEYTVKVSPAGCDSEKWSDAITFSTTVPCPTPESVTASNVTTSSATISWTSDGDKFNLKYATYSTSVSADTHPGDTHDYDFDDGTLQGWTNIDADGDGNVWVSSAEPGIYHNSGVDLSGRGHHASEGFVISGSYSNRTNQGLTPDNYLVSPKIMLGGSISFYAGAQDKQFPEEHFGVAVSTKGNTTAADFTTIKEWTLTAEGEDPGTDNQGAWSRYTVDLSAYAGQEGYVAIRHFNCSDVFCINVDDITIVEGEAAGTTWTPINNVQCSMVDGQWAYTLTGLTSGATYSVRVQSVCGGIDGESDWSLLTSFTTFTSTSAPRELNATDITATTAKLNWAGAQSSYNVRYGVVVVDNFLTEGFEGGIMPDGWTRTDSYWKVTSGTGHDQHTGAATGSYNAGCYAKQRDYSDMLITPAMDLSGAESVTLSFNFWNTNWSGDVNTLNVKYRVDGGEWQSLCSKYQATDGWTRVTVPLKGLDANYQIGFECVGNYSYGMGIDDVVVKSEAHVNEWTTVSDNSQFSTLNSQFSYSLTGLTRGTQYLWQVQGNDGNGGTTDWSEVATFTTVDGTDITLYDNGDLAQGNSITIINNNNEGQKVNVTLQGRTLFKDGNWNTLCLPFAVALDGSPLAGATLMELDATGTYKDNEDNDRQTGLASDGTLYLYFKNATAIEAGKPYIIKWVNTGGAEGTEDTELKNPTFNGVTVTSTTAATVTASNSGLSTVEFRGIYDPVMLTGGDKSTLYLGLGKNAQDEDVSTLYYPDAAMTINAFRAYFHVDLDGSEGGCGQVRAFSIHVGDDAEANGIEEIENRKSVNRKSIEAWYDLQGRKVNSQFSILNSQLKKGVYIRNGKKHVINN